jgi:uncharacterized protein (DUF934 family)
MALIIKKRSVASDPWHTLKSADDGGLPSLPPVGDVIVPLALWRAERDTLRLRAERIGVWLDSHEDPALIAEDLPLFGVVAVNFPKFTDGRGYSIARLLRERYGYRGELRAIGDVQRDQLFYLARCGFNAFALRAGEDPRAALSAFGDFSDAYQNSVERPLPLFRRRNLSGESPTNS